MNHSELSLDKMPEINSVIGIMKKDGFYRFYPTCKEGYRKTWCCDPFEVSQITEKLEFVDHLLIKVRFKKWTGAITFDWDLNNLNHLKSPHILVDTLMSHGIRVSSDPLSEMTIFNAVMRPDLVIAVQS